MKKRSERTGLNVVMRLNKRVVAIKRHAKRSEDLFIEELKRRKYLEIDRNDHKDLLELESNIIEWLFCRLMAYKGRGCGINVDEVKALLNDYTMFRAKQSLECKTKIQTRHSEMKVENSFYYNYEALRRL